MSDVPVQVIIAAFQDEQGAAAALDMLKGAKRERLIGIQDAAVLRKDESGKLHIKETADMGGVSERGSSRFCRESPRGRSGRGCPLASYR